jgi:hypothetical protein
MYAQQADANSTISDVENQVVLKSDSKNPAFSEDMRGLIEKGPATFSPIDFGNVHDNYVRARYQNIRFNLLKNMTGQFLFGFQTPLEMGNQIVMSQTPDRNSQEYNGVWTITDKIVFIQGTIYNEKIVAVKNGLDQKGK